MAIRLERPVLSSDRAPPILLVVALILLFGRYYGPMLGIGELQSSDEYLTLGRSHEILTTGDWLSIHSNYTVDFKKPPLQYWLTAIAMTALEDEELALRLWPYLFCLGLLAAVALLAYALIPERPYAMPTAVLLLSASPLLWRYGIGAFLDAGAAFLFTLALALFFLTLREPRWAVPLGLTVGLGALQKAPMGLAAVAVRSAVLYLTRRAQGCDLRPLLASRQVQIGLALALLLSLSWPAMQLARHGFDFIETAYIEEIVHRFAPVALTLPGGLTLGLKGRGIGRRISELVMGGWCR